ncbi:SprB repeat-containing protein, partial [Flavobacterium sp.]|uniref:SprB repeat-containing protein n=1 Tax=Flavobacterium sp. TaxID=239 RepID=UPI0022C1FA89
MKKPTILQMLSLENLCPFSKNLSLLLAKFVITNPMTNKLKNRFLSHAFALVGILFFMTQSSNGQNLKSFDIRFDRNVKGDQLLIGNNILSVNNNDFNDNGVFNSDVDMQYVDIDGDTGTFSSSSAVLTIPNSNAPGTPCYKIAYAALYWSAIIRDGDNSLDRTKFTTIKFKTPVGGYNTVTGQLIYDAINQTDGIGASKNRPYACYADVSSLVQPLANANGTYTVANVLSSVGKNGSTGLSAGWSLYIVYEDPNLPARSITSYDGFSGIGGATTLDINVTGFRTIPVGPVNASFAFAALEGDKPIKGDYLEINGVRQSAATASGTTLRATDNFFNSSITYIDPITKNTADFSSPNRIPASSNTLGYDTGIITIKNDNNSAIGNNVTSAKITLGSTQDVYFYYFNAIAVEIIEPKIILTKTTLKGVAPLPNNAPVGLGEQLTYQLQFQNVGNDNAKNFTITDQLPANTIFNYPVDIDPLLPAGVTHTYNATTRTITFTVPDNLVLKNGSKSVPILFKVQVVPTCANLTEPCNNIIKNTARSKYTGQINTNGGLGFGEDSYASFSACTISVPESTNFLVGVDDCKKRNDVLCGDNVTISATGGYASYSWSTSPTGTPVIGTSQTLTVTKPGTYYVKNTATPPCVDLEEIITVADYAAKPANPLIQYADNKNPATGLIDQCVNDGSILPKIFLCGQSASKLLDLSSLGATKITWETTTCVPDPNLSDLCANVSPTCTWTTAAPDGNTFTANASGQYRVSIYFGGCFSRFYFNVYKNPLNPTATKKDMICGNNGNITINGVGAGYEYSLTKTSGYQSSNTFSIATAGTYTVYIRQVGVVTNPCIFEVSGIQIYKIDFNPIAPFITQPLCHDSKGSIKVYGTGYNGAQYTYELFKGGVSIEKVINSTASEYEFTNKDAGDYTFRVSTLDGCSYNGVAKIIAPAALTASPAITKPLTCTNGEITVTPSNGTAPFYYYVNGSTIGQTDPKIVITTAGTYAIKVVDKNNCEFNIPPITINANPKPDFSLTSTNILCYGANTGEIKFNVTNANGYTLAYSINNGVTYVANGTFSSLPPGTYTPVLKYSLSGVDCFETRPNISITQPAEAVTASMGVSELAGCGDVSLGIPKNYGRVRITNPQGGVAPYQYSFDNQATWTTVNDAYKAPGTYTLYVKDTNGCIFSASVTIDPEPAAPQIDVNTPVDFNCDGTATSTVTVTNPGGSTYTYDYYLDGTKNTNVPSNVFLNVSPGPHNIKVEYKLNTVPTFSNLLYENFGYGDDTTSPGMNATYYCFERQVLATQCRGSIAINDGDYSVTARIVAPFGPWLQPGDHTPPTVPPTPKGRCLVVNIGSQIPETEILYEKIINNIIPNQPITFEFFAMNLLNKNNFQFDPDLRVALVDASGTEISWYNTGNIPKSEKWENYPKTAFTLDPKTNTTLKFIVRSNVRQTSGNDVAIDDIKVFQLPKTCTTTKDFTIVVPTGKAFTSQISGNKSVTCNGESNGEITIAAQNFDPIKGFEYSKDNGVTWQTSTTSPVKLTSLGAALYKVVVRPVGATVTTCSKPFDVTISAPPTLTLSASETKKATCTTGATITAVAGGGTPAYEYELRQTDGLTVVSGFAFSNNGGIFNNVPVGTYTVFVRDANSCSNPVGVGVAVTAVPAISAVLDSTTDYCYTTANPAKLDVKVTGGTGRFTYQLNANAAVSSAATTYSFTNVAPGTHTIVVTDSNNCSATISNIVIAPQQGFAVSLIDDLTCIADAKIDNPVVTGGNGGPYTYTRSFNGVGAIATTFPFTTNTAGTYVFTVTDSKGCPATSNTIIVTAKTTPTIATSKTDITCNNANDGTITVMAAGGFTSAYIYILTGPKNVTQATNKFTALPAGTYTVSVTDSKGCPSATQSVIIANPALITANATLTTSFTCSPTNTKQAALITVTPTGGTGGYTYSYNNGASFGSSNTLTVNDNGTTQSIKIIVKDANGCLSAMELIDLAPLNPPTIATISNTPIYCAPPTSTTSIVTVPVTAGTGVAPLAYTIISGPVTNTTGATTGIFSGLTAGTYVFRVTDANGCYATKSHNVPALTPIAVTATKLTDVDCFGNTTGSAIFTVSSFSSTGNYNITVSSTPASLPYTLSPSGDVRTLTGLVAGTYTFSVTDILTGCTDSKSVTITQPTAALTITNATATNVFCSNDNSQITVTATGGTTNYGYAAVISGASAPTVFGTSNVITVDTNSGANLVWDVYVRDAKGCTTLPFPVTIINNGSPIVTASVTNQCSASGSTFQIVAVGSSGLAPYTYTINTGLAPSPANTFTVAAGTYTITVRDANGCPATTTVIVNQALSATALVTKDITCSLPQEATIKVDVLGGLAPFSYKVDIDGAGFGAATSFGGTTFNYTDTGITTGKSYRFEITDANGCPRITNVVNTITPTPVAATTSITNLTCYQSGNGVVTINPTAGVAPFQYSFNGSGFSTVSTYSNLAASTGLGYPYVVRDSKGCLYPGYAVVNQPTEITYTVTPVNMTCTAAIVAGSITVNAITNGVAPFNYTLRNLTTGVVLTHSDLTGSSYTFPNLGFGNYEVIVSDNTGCSKSTTGIQVLSPPDDLFIDLYTTADCTNGATIIVSVNPTPIPSSPDYEFGIYDLAVFPYSSSFLAPDGAALPDNLKKTFTNLTPGVVYTFVVRDNITGCYYFEKASGPIPPLTGLTSNPIVANNVTCTGTATGSVTFTLDNYTATSVNWEIFSDQTNVSTGISGTISTSAPSTITSPSGLVPGTYYVKFTEVGGSYNGCTSASATFSIIESPVLLDLNASATKNDNCNTNAGQVVGVANGGTAPYRFILNTSNTAPALSDPLWNAPSTFNVESGNYYVWVKDSRGCIVGKPVSVLLDPTPVIALSIVNKCAPQGTFGITVTATTAGTGAYTISVDGGTFASIPGLPHTVTGLNSGLHTIIIKDANGCTDTETITIDEPLVATPAITALPTCANNDGVITMSGAGGPVAGTYIYTIAPTFPSVVINSTTGVISGLPAGTYTVTMTDTATPTNCTTTAVVTLGAPTPVTFTTATTPALCVGDNNGTITVTLGAGNNNPSYTYEIIAGPQLAVAQSSNIFTGLLPGTYTVRVNSGRGCRLDDTNVIVAPATPLTATATFPANTTCSTVTVITVSAGGGTSSGYLYNFNGLGYTSDPTYKVNDNGSIQTISYRVKDANGCETLLQTIDVNPLNKPTDLNFVVSTAPTCPAPTSGVTVTATNGVGALTFEIVQFNGAPTTLYPAQITAGFAVPAVFNNLPVGDYLFQVTDANGCTYQESHTVAPVTNITVAASASTDVTCFGLANGTATFKVTDFTSYTAVLTVGTGTPFIAGDIITLTGLVPGNYTLQVTDATTGCTDDVSFVIAEPIALGLSLISNVNANCNSGAIVTVQGTNGTPNYTYAFVANNVTPIPTDYTVSNNATLAVTLPSPNEYDVWVKDANGCTFKLDVTVVMDANPTNITLDTTTFSECPDPINGTYTFTVKPPTGVGPFQYSIGGGFQNSPTFVVNAPGSYDVTVKDKNGCPTTATALVVIRQPLVLTPTVTTPVSCANGDGVISVSTTGGSGTYQYKIDTGAYPMTTPFTGLAFGTHRVFVRDIATGCEVFADIDLQQATPITGFDLAKTEVTCNGGSDGTITATMFTPAPGVNDNPVYTYTLTGTTTVGNLPVARPAQDSPLFSGLRAGTYTVVVSSARACTDTKTITIVEPALIVVPTITPVPFGCTSGNARNLATITVAGVTGGSSTYLNYEFIKNGTPVQFGASNVYTEGDLSGGSYIVNVYDNKGCKGTSTTPIIIAPYVQLDKINVNVTRPITCLLSENITVSATTIGTGTTDLEFSLVDIDASTGTQGTLYTKQTNKTGNFSNLPVGNYFITVKNLLTNCEIIGVHYVNEPNTFDLTIDNVVDVTCLGGTNGSARVTLIDRVPTPIDNAGPFDYTVEDALGNLIQNASSTATGTVNLTNLAKGTYTITATLTGPPNCTVSKNFTITGPNVALAIDKSFTEITCVAGNNDGSISATATGGWPGGYEFRLEKIGTVIPIADWSTTSTFEGLTAGNYVVKVRDSRGCEVFTTVDLNNPTPIAFTTTTTNAALLCKGDRTASISVNQPVTGGQGTNYLYTLNTTSVTPMISSGPQADPVFTNLGAGTYTVTVTDGWGCGTTSTTPIGITEPTEVVPTLVLASTQTCTILSTLTLSATGGTGTYTYSADGSFNPTGSLLTYGTFATTTTILNVPVGTYRYYVRDGNQCISVVSNDIKIEPLPVLKVDLDVQNAKINCKGDANGVIVATATGGLGNYVYTLLNGVGGALGFTPVQTTPGNFTQLRAGTYKVRVDSEDCNVVSTGIVTITEPLVPVTATAVPTPVTCNGAANGIITVTASGGTGTMKYAIEPRLDQFFDTGVFDELAPGTYQVIAQDENGCFVLLSATITEPQAIFVNTVAGSEVQEL